MPVARNGNPDDEFYSEPTQYANYGGSGGQAYSALPEEQTAYSPDPDYGHPTDYGYPTDYGHAPVPEPPAPWYRKPAALVGLGAWPRSSWPWSSTRWCNWPAVRRAPRRPPPHAPNEPSASVAPGPAPGGTQTVTESPSRRPRPRRDHRGADHHDRSPTTTTTTAPPSVSTSTVTETQTVSPTRTFPTSCRRFPRPGNGGSGGDGGGQ